MPNNKITADVLAQFGATVDSNPNLSDADMLKKFPEFNNDSKTLQSAKEYYVTANSGKYKSLDEVNTKFPEFFSESTPEKKKPESPTTSLLAPTTSASATGASEQGNTPNKLTENIQEFNKPIGSKYAENVKEAFNKYPGLKSFSQPSDYLVQDATGRMGEILRKHNAALEFQNKGQVDYEYGSDKMKLDNPDKHRLYLNNDRINDKNRQGAIEADIVSHALHNNPEYDQFTKELNKKLVDKIGAKAVEREGTVDAFVRGYISKDPEYDWYKTILKDLPKGTFDKLDNILYQGKNINIAGQQIDLSKQETQTKPIEQVNYEDSFKNQREKVVKDKIKQQIIADPEYYSDPANRSELYKGISPLKLIDKHGIVAESEKVAQYAPEIKQLSELINKNPNDATSFTKLAAIQTEIGDKESAINNYRIAASTDKTLSKPLYGLGYMALKDGDHEQAQQYFNEGLRRNPKNYKILSASAYNKYQTGDYNGALADIDKAIELNHTEENYLSRASILYKQGDRKLYKEDIKTAEAIVAVKKQQPLSIGAPGTHEYDTQERANRVADLAEQIKKGEGIFIFANPGGSVSNAMLEGLNAADEQHRQTASIMKKEGVAAGAMNELAALAKGGFALATPLTEGMLAFHFATGAAKTIVPEDYINMVTAPIATAMESYEKSTGNKLPSIIKNAGSLVDVVASLAVMKGIEHGSAKLVEAGRAMLAKKPLTPEMQSEIANAAHSINDADIEKVTTAFKPVTVPEDIKAEPVKEGETPLETPVKKGEAIMVDHGETDQSKSNITSGTNNEPLNEEGIKQAKEKGEEFKKKGITNIIASPVERASQTANIAGEESGAKVSHDEDMRAWDKGDQVGKPKSDFNEDHYIDNPDEEVPGGESLNSVVERQKNVLKKMQESPEDTAFINHSSNIRIINALIAGGEIDGEGKYVWNEKAKEDFRKNRDIKTDKVYSFPRTEEPIKTEEKYIESELANHKDKLAELNDITERGYGDFGKYKLSNVEKDIVGKNVHSFVFDNIESSDPLKSNLAKKIFIESEYAGGDGKLIINKLNESEVKKFIGKLDFADKDILRGTKWSDLLFKDITDTHLSGKQKDQLESLGIKPLSTSGLDIISRGDSRKEGIDYSSHNSDLLNNIVENPEGKYMYPSSTLKDLKKGGIGLGIYGNRGNFPGIGVFFAPHERSGKSYPMMDVNQFKSGARAYTHQYEFKREPVIISKEDALKIAPENFSFKDKKHLIDITNKFNELGIDGVYDRGELFLFKPNEVVSTKRIIEESRRFHEDNIHHITPGSIARTYMEGRNKQLVSKVDELLKPQPEANSGDSNVGGREPIKTEEHDNQNKQGVQGEIGVGQEPGGSVQEPVGSSKEAEGGGVLQTQERIPIEDVKTIDDAMTHFKNEHEALNSVNKTLREEAALESEKSGETIEPKQYTTETIKDAPIDEFKKTIERRLSKEPIVEKPVSGIKKGLIEKEKIDKIMSSIDLNKISDKEMLSKGKELRESGKINTDEIVHELVSGHHRALQPEEVVSLIHHKAELDNNLDKAYREKNELLKEGKDTGTIDAKITLLEKADEDFDTAAIITAHQQSLAFRLRKGILNRDYSLAKQKEKYKANNKGVIPEEVEAEWVKRDARIKDLERQIKDQEAVIENQKNEAVINNIKAAGKRKSKPKETLKTEAEKPSLSPEKQTRLKELRGKYQGRFNDILRVVATVAEKDFREYASLILEEAKGDFKSFARKIVSELGSKIKPYLHKLFSELGGKHKEEDVFTNGKIKISKSLIHDLVEGGIDNIEDLTKEVHDVIRSEYPDATERDVRDAITKYGETSNLDPEEIATEIRRIKRMGRYKSQLEDIQNKKRPSKSGMQRDEIGPEERVLIKKIREGLKELPVSEAESEQMFKTANESIKTRLTKEIEDIQHQIDTNERAPARKGIDYTEENKDLVRQRNELRDELDIKVPKEGLTQEQINENAVQAINKRIEKLSERLRKRELEVEKQESKVDKKDPEYIKATERLEKGKEFLSQLIKETTDILDRKRAESLVKNTEKAIKELKRRISEKDFSKKEKKKPIIENTLLTQLRAEKLKYDEDFNKLKYKNEIENRTNWVKTMDATREALSIPRALIASLDLSAVLVQGLVRTVTKPRQAAYSLKEMFKQMGSEKYSENWVREVKAQDYYPGLKASKLYLAEHDVKMSLREEQFVSGWINHVWDGVGKPIDFVNKKAFEKWKKANPYKIAERAYTGYVNAIRLTSYLEGVKYLEKEGLTHELNPKEYESWASYVNNATGRGGLGKFEDATKALQVVFFSPRKIMSRINLLSPVFYAKLSPHARKMALINFASFISVTATVVALAKAGGAQVETDPNSSDYMKIKIGNTRIDLWGGFQQEIVLASRLITGKTKTTNGVTKDISKTRQDKADLIGIFFKNKVSPTVGLGFRLLGDTRKGEDVTMENELIKNVIPIYAQDLKNLYKEHDAATASALATLAIFGGSVNTYSNKKK